MYKYSSLIFPVNNWCKTKYMLIWVLIAYIMIVSDIPSLWASCNWVTGDSGIFVHFLIMAMRKN